MLQLLSNFRKDDLSAIVTGSHSNPGQNNKSIGNFGFNSILANMQKNTDFFLKKKAAIETSNDFKTHVDKKISSKNRKDKTLNSDNHDPTKERINKMESAEISNKTDSDKSKVSGSNGISLKSRIENLSEKIKGRLNEDDLDSDTGDDMLELLDLFTQINPDKMSEKSINDIEKALKMIDKLLSEKEADNQLSLAKIRDFFSSNEEMKKILDDLKNLIKKSLVNSDRGKNGFKKNLAAAAKDEIDLEVKDLRMNDLSKLNNRKLIVKSSSKRISANSRAKPDAEFKLNTEIDVSIKNNASTGQNDNAALGSNLKDSGRLYNGIKEFTRKTGIKQPRKIFNQLVERARVTLKSGMSEMKLQIKPRFLGRIKMQLMLKNGSLSGKISIGNESLRNFLQQNLHELGTELRDAGIDLKQLEIVYDQSSSGKKNSNNPENGGFSNQSSAEKTVGKDEPQIYSGVLHHSGIVNLVA